MKALASENTAAQEGLPGGDAAPARRPLRELIDDRVLDELLERSRDEAGGARCRGMPRTS